ncbi:hypothetical protein TWF696_006201 [Orbilia brochopaga]|uniref:Uncharacterized protein n=1 Tax=Orbilia brochopaga TaxID=3140254 RepID=A0AAV9V1Y7_9PEZI
MRRRESQYFGSQQGESSTSPPDTRDRQEGTSQEGTSQQDTNQPGRDTPSPDTQDETSQTEGGETSQTEGRETSQTEGGETSQPKVGETSQSRARKRIGVPLASQDVDVDAFSGQGTSSTSGQDAEKRHSSESLGSSRGSSAFRLLSGWFDSPWSTPGQPSTPPADAFREVDLPNVTPTPPAAPTTGDGPSEPMMSLSSALAWNPPAEWGVVGSPKSGKSGTDTSTDASDFPTALSPPPVPGRPRFIPLDGADDVGHRRPTVPRVPELADVGGLLANEPPPEDPDAIKPIPHDPDEAETDAFFDRLRKRFDPDLQEVDTTDSDSGRGIDNIGDGAGDSPSPQGRTSRTGPPINVTDEPSGKAHQHTMRYKHCGHGSHKHVICEETDPQLCAVNINMSAGDWCPVCSQDSTIRRSIRRFGTWVTQTTRRISGRSRQRNRPAIGNVTFSQGSGSGGGSGGQTGLFGGGDGVGEQEEWSRTGRRTRPVGTYRMQTGSSVGAGGVDPTRHHDTESDKS